MERKEQPLIRRNKRKTKLPNDLTGEERLRWYAKWKTLTVHPNLKIDYFQQIDTKEKAYWLGFLCADGNLTRSHGSIQIRLKLGRKDEDTIDAFCECLGLEKSKIIEYPANSLATRELELAFLLGYYDGDGTQRRTDVSSGSKRFLEQIKLRFSIPCNIWKDEVEGSLLGRKIKGTSYRMYLGAELFNEMMSNFRQSMPRKRWHPCSEAERVQRVREALTLEKIRKRKERQARWRAITPINLQKLIRDMPVSQIASNYNVNPHAVEKKCDKHGIPRPRGQGYWKKRRALERGQP